MLSPSFLARMKRILGSRFEGYEESFSLPRKNALQLNRTKGDVSLSFPTEPISYYADGRYFSAEKPGSHPLHHAGAYYIQEPSAMAPVASLVGRLPTDARVLDVCASPGGKTSQLARLFCDSPMIVSNEIVPNRCKTLVGNIERLGFRNVLCLNSDAEFLEKSFPEAFSVILCDAPCSGEGMFRKSEDAVEMWSEENVALCAARQRDILSHVKNCVCPGGYLLYSTCTYSPEENEENISDFLEKNPDFSLCAPGNCFDDVSLPGYAPACRNFDPSLVRRFYPHISGGEGQFFALLRRDGPREERAINVKSSLRALTKDESKAACAFLKDTLGHAELSLFASGENILILPDGMCAPARHIFSCGVKLGEYKAGRIVPHHQFFSAFGKDFLRKADFSSDSEEIRRYLHGEGFSCSLPDGFCAVTVDGIALGGAKIVDGYLKNHYPKGLRI